MFHVVKDNLAWPGMPVSNTSNFAPGAIRDKASRTEHAMRIEMAIGNVTATKERTENQL
jgi:hypothetical protein